MRGAAPFRRFAPPSPASGRRNPTAGLAPLSRSVKAGLDPATPTAASGVRSPRLGQLVKPADDGAESGAGRETSIILERGVLAIEYVDMLDSHSEH